MTKILYLAGPYTRGSSAAREARFNALTHAAAKLIEKKYIVYSPITMTHPIDLVLADDNETLGSDYWVNFDEAFMEHCSEMVVVMLPGWEESSGVKREIEYFEKRGVKPKFCRPEEFGILPDNRKFRAAFE